MKNGIVFQHGQVRDTFLQMFLYLGQRPTPEKISIKAKFLILSYNADWFPIICKISTLYHDIDNNIYFMF